LGLAGFGELADFGEVGRLANFGKLADWQILNVKNETCKKAGR